MTAIETLRKRILAALPNARTTLDRPRAKAGAWWLDIEFDGHEVAVEWRPRCGFGIHCSAEPAPFSGPEEVVKDLAAATERVSQLLRAREFARPPRTVALRELREMAKMTQEELAEKLGVGQAAVSKMERRSDITLAVLRRWIKSIGGDLEILAKFPDEVVRIGQFDDVDDAA